MALGEWFRESADSGSLVRYLETFDHTIAVMQTKEGLFRVAKEFVEDLADDGVVYGEVRWAPEQHLPKGLTLDEAVEAVQAGLEAGVDAVAETARHPGGPADHRHAPRRPLARRSPNWPSATATTAPSASTSPVPRTASCPRASRTPSPTWPSTSSRPPSTPAKPPGWKASSRALVNGRALRLGHGVRIAEDITVEFEADDEDGEKSTRTTSAW